MCNVAPCRPVGLHCNTSSFGPPGTQAVASGDSQDEQHQESSSNPSYSTGASEYSGSGDGQSGGNVPSAPSGDNPEDNPLLDQLLSTQEQGGDFHTTSAEVRWFDCSSASRDGARPIGDQRALPYWTDDAVCQQAALA